MIAQDLLSITKLASLPPLLAELGPRDVMLLALGAILVLIGILFLVFFAKYFTLWLQAYMSNARVGPLNLIWMGLRQVNPGVIVEGKIMAMQAGVGTDPDTGITTQRLEAHYLAGGDVPRVINAIIAAQRADIDLDFDRAAAIDLAGRDVLDAVRTSVYPKVIDCPDPEKSPRARLAPWPRNGVELQDSRAGHRAHQPVAADRRGHRRYDHRPRGRGIITSIGSAKTISR